MFSFPSFLLGIVLFFTVLLLFNIAARLNPGVKTIYQFIFKI